MGMKLKFTIDHRYNHIGFDDWLSWAQIDPMQDWCDENGNYEVYATGIVYKTEQDLTAFLLRWQ
jgi:hypothetical protein